MVRLATAALLIAYLPGAIVFRAPIAQRGLRARLPAEERAFWAIILSVTWAIAVVMALAACGVYTFSRLLWVEGATVSAMLILWRGRLRYCGDAVRPSAAGLIPIAIVAGGIWLYTPPSEYVMGGKDPGSYVSEGTAIAHRGTLAITDPDVSAVPPDLRDLFFPEFKDMPYYGLRFMGFFVMDPDRGTVMGQFPHWLPASMAIGDGFAGVTGVRYTIVAWALLGLLAVYFAGADAFGRVAAAAGTGLLAINVIEVWYARYPNTELPTQAMVFAALLAFRRAAAGSRGFFGLVAGALVSLPLFLRYDQILAILAFTAAATLMTANRERIGWTFGFTTAAVSALGLWYLMVPMRPYSNWYFDVTLTDGRWALLVGTLSVVLFRLYPAERFRDVLVAATPVALAAAVSALAIYAYFFRVAHGTLADMDASAFRSFAWYVTKPGLLVAVAATAWLTRRRFWSTPALYLLVVIYSVFFFYKMHIVPDHFWASRRYVTIALPAVTLFTAAFAADLLSAERIASWLRRTRLASGPGIGVGVLSAVLTGAAMTPVAHAYWTQAAPVRSHVEYAGMVRYVESLVARIGPDDLLLVESRQADSDLHVLALPLAYMYQRHVLVLDSVRPDKRKLEAFVTWAETRYARILFLGGGGTDLLTRQIAAQPIASERFQVPEYASTRNAYPTGVRYKEFDFGLYRLVPARPRQAGPIDLTIGVLDDLNVVHFYAKEQHSRTGVLFRWTKSTATVMVLGVEANMKEAVVWMSDGGRPRSAPPGVVTVSVGNRLLGTATPVDEVRPYRFALPPDLVARAAEELDPLPLGLEVTTWNPHTLLGAPDTRELGVMVTRVEVR